MPEYTHTLIPEKVNFVPNPGQVSGFIGSLTSMGAAPMKATMTVAKLTGKVNTFANPFTGGTITIPVREAKTITDLSRLPDSLKDLDDYEVTLAGKGPPKLPAFKFQFEGAYDFQVNCSLREKVVYMSDWHDEIPIKRKVEFFGEQCSPKARLGIFHNPDTLEVIEVPNAGCARFWIEFEFGKTLFPKINDCLDLIAPPIVKAAQEAFAISFIQGCRWCA
jgi:hypothetical protein